MQEYVSRSEFETFRVAAEERFKRDFDRINKIEGDQDALHDLATAVQVQSNEMTHLKTDIGEIKETVNALAAKPAKRWDGLVDKILIALAGAFIAWMLAGCPTGT